VGEEEDHAGACFDVGVGHFGWFFSECFDVGGDEWCDVDGDGGDVVFGGDDVLVLSVVVGGGFVGHEEAEDVFFAEGLGGEDGDDGAVDAAGESEDDAVGACLCDVCFDEVFDDGGGFFGVGGDGDHGSQVSRDCLVMAMASLRMVLVTGLKLALAMAKGMRLR